MPTLQIVPVPGFVDNYFWTLHDGTSAVVVDPGDARPVLKFLKEHQLKLSAILVTHHHPDHIGGIAAILKEHEVPVFGPAAEARSIKLLSTQLSEGDRVELQHPSLALNVWEVPGHTLGHIAYVSVDRRFVLCGDTLFSAGCGRLFEGTAEQLHGSLQRLAGLPADTQVYCTHEYTQANLSFAQAVEPGNEAIAREVERVAQLRQQGQPSLPSNIRRELSINPFLRVGSTAVQDAAGRYAGQNLESGNEVFAALRRWKDGFRG